MRVSALLLVLVAAGCLPATVHGLRTDGVLPPPGSIEGTLSAGAGGPLGEGDTVGGGAIGLVVPLGESFAVAPSVGAAGRAWGFDLEGRLGLLDTDELVVTALFGAGAVGPDSWTFGLHAGAVVAKPISGTTRIFGGARLNPVLNDEVDDVPWFHVSFGTSARPVGDRYRGLSVLGEVFWEIPLTEPDRAGIGAMVTFGLTAPLPGSD